MSASTAQLFPAPAAIRLNFPCGVSLTLPVASSPQQWISPRLSIPHVCVAPALSYSQVGPDGGVI